MFDNNSLKALYNECNERYFNNELDGSIKVEWSTRQTRIAGNCRYKIINKKRVPERIALSVPYHKKFPNQIIETLVHEMIHQKLPEAKHGELFLKEMKRLNDIYDLNINVYSTERALINYEYTCSKCNQVFKRSNKINLKKYTCNCKGKLIEKNLK